MTTSTKRCQNVSAHLFASFRTFFISFSWVCSSFSTFGFIFFPGFHLFEFPVSSFWGSGFIFLRLSEVQVLEKDELFCSYVLTVLFIFFSFGFSFLFSSFIFFVKWLHGVSASFIPRLHPSPSWSPSFSSSFHLCIHLCGDSVVTRPYEN